MPRDRIARCPGTVIVEPHPVQQGAVVIPARNRRGPRLPGCGWRWRYRLDAAEPHHPNWIVRYRPLSAAASPSGAGAHPEPCWPAPDPIGPSGRRRAGTLAHGGHATQRGEKNNARARVGDQEQQPYQGIHPIAVCARAGPGLQSPQLRLVWPAVRLRLPARFLAAQQYRLLPRIGMKAYRASSSRYSASMDSRVDALTLVTSGGRRNGAHSLLVGHLGIPAGRQPGPPRRRSAAHRVPAACSTDWHRIPTPYKVSGVSSKASSWVVARLGNAPSLQVLMVRS